MAVAKRLLTHLLKTWDDEALDWAEVFFCPLRVQTGQIGQTGQIQSVQTGPSLSVSERRGEDLKGVTGVYLKAKAGL